MIDPDNTPYILAKALIDAPIDAADAKLLRLDSPATVGSYIEVYLAVSALDMVSSALMALQNIAKHPEMKTIPLDARDMAEVLHKKAEANLAFSAGTAKGAERLTPQQKEIAGIRGTIFGKARDTLIAISAQSIMQEADGKPGTSLESEDRRKLPPAGRPGRENL